MRGAAAAGAAAASAAAVCVHFTASCIHARSSDDMAATAARAAAPMPATQCASASMPGGVLNDRERGVDKDVKEGEGGGQSAMVTR